MTNDQIVKCCEPFYVLWNPVFNIAFRSVREAASLIGAPNKIERAGMMHAAVRSELQPLCDRLEPIVRLVEVDGADCMLVDAGDEQLAVCWGRYKNGQIRRNPTQRQSHIQIQKTLPFSEGSIDDLQGEVAAVSIGYTVEDDYIEAGCPAWWIGRLVLVHEGPRSSEFIHDICVYSKDSQQNESDRSILADTFIEIRTKERRTIGRLADKLRRKIG